MTTSTPSATSIADLIDATRQQAVEADHRKYRLLVHKAADDALTAKATGELQAVMARLGIETGRLRDDLHALAERRRLTELAAERDSAIKRVADAQSAIASFNAETRRRNEQRALEGAPLDTEMVSAEAALATAVNAADRLRQIEQEHAELFALPDPTLIRRRLHLRQLLRGEKPQAEADVSTLNFSALMADPTTAESRLEGRELSCAPDQPVEEFTELVALANQIADGTLPNPAYLISRDDAAVLPALAGFPLPPLYVFDPKGESINALDPSEHSFILHPGQTHEQLDATIAAAQKFFDRSPAGQRKKHRAMMDRPGVVSYDRTVITQAMSPVRAMSDRSAGSLMERR